MTNNHSTSNRSNLVATRRNNPCQICGDTTGKCRESTNGELALCVKPPEGFDLSRFKLDVTGRWYSIPIAALEVDYQPREYQARERVAKPIEKESLSVSEIDTIYRGLIEKIGLSKIDKNKINARGIEVTDYPSFSVAREKLNLKVNSLFPGVKDGYLTYYGDGYTVPSFDLAGRVSGYQVRYHNLESKYMWNAGYHNHIEVIKGLWELPITHLIQTDWEASDRILYLSEGLLKPYVAHKKHGISILGAAGGMFGSSPKQVELAVRALKPREIRVAVDGGSTGNKYVLGQLARTYHLLRKIDKSIKVSFIWYGQSEKASNDIDEIVTETLQSASLLTVDEFFSLSSHGSDDRFSHFVVSKVNGKYKYHAVSSSNTLAVTDDLKTYWEIVKNHTDSVLWVSRFNLRNARELLLDKVALKNIEKIVLEIGDRRVWEDENQSSYFGYLNRLLDGYFGDKPLLNSDDYLYVKEFKGVEPNLTETSLAIFDPELYFFNMQYYVTDDKSKDILVKARNRLIPLRLLVALGHVDIPNADRKTLGKYLPSIDVLDIMGKIVGIRANKGTGKSEQSRQIIRDVAKLFGGIEHVKVTAIAPTIRLNINLADAISTGTGCHCVSYNQLQSEKISQDLFNFRLNNVPCLSLCINSVGRLTERQYDEASIVIIDEFEQIYKSLVCPSHIGLREKSEIRRELKRMIVDVVAAGGIVYLADADLSETAFTSFCDWLDIPHNSRAVYIHESDNCGYSYFAYDDRAHLTGNIIESIAKGDRIAIFSDSKDYLEKLELKLINDFPDKRIEIIHKDNVAFPEKAKIMSNLNYFCQKIDVFGLSPTGQSGIDITYSGFNRVYGVFFGILTPDSTRQMLMRVRDLSCDRHIWCAEKRLGVPNVKIWEKETARKYLIEQTLAEFETISGNPIEIDLLTNFISNRFTNHWINLQSHYFVREQTQKDCFRDAVLGGLLVLENCRIKETTQTQDDPSCGLMVDLKQEGEQLESRRAQLIYQAKDFNTYAEKEVLKNKSAKTEAELMRILKSDWIERLPGLDIDFEFAKEYLVTYGKRKTLYDFRRACNCANFPLVHKLYKTTNQRLISEIIQNDWQVATGDSYRGNYECDQALALIGLDMVIKLLVDNADKDGKGKIDFDNPIITKSLDKFTKSKKFYLKKLGIYMTFRASREHKLKKLLRIVGLKVSINKKGIVAYQLPLKFVEIIKAFESALQIRADKVAETDWRQASPKTAKPATSNDCGRQDFLENRLIKEKINHYPIGLHTTDIDIGRLAREAIAKMTS